MTTPTDYYSNPRPDLHPYILADNPSRVLDVGCADGELGAALKKKGVDYVFGVEIDRACYTKARGRLDQLMTGSIENAWFRADWECGGKFDVIVFGDVLEHLREPWSVLKGVRQWLSPGGRVVVSMPNAGFVDDALKLLSQSWRLSDSGIKDRTHLRWFCRDDLRRLVSEAGYEVETLEPLHRTENYPEPGFIPEGSTTDVAINLSGNIPLCTLHGATQDLVEQLQTYQWICVGRI